MKDRCEKPPLVVPLSTIKPKPIPTCSCGHPWGWHGSTIDPSHGSLLTRLSLPMMRALRDLYQQRHHEDWHATGGVGPVSPSTWRALERRGLVDLVCGAEQPRPVEWVSITDSGLMVVSAYYQGQREQSACPPPRSA